MNIKEFNVTNKPFETTLVFELYEGSEFDKKAYRILKKEKALFADGKFDDEVFAYDITNKMSLRKYMSMGMNQKKMLYMMERLADADICFKTNGLDRQYLMYDADLVLVDKMSEEITFIYVPATDHGLTAKPLKVFMKEILANAVYDEMENLDYVGRLLTYMNKNKRFEPEDLSGVLEEIRNNQRSLNVMEESAAVELAKADAAFVPAEESDAVKIDEPVFVKEPAGEIKIDEPSSEEKPILKPIEEIIPKSVKKVPEVEKVQLEPIKEHVAAKDVSEAEAIKVPSKKYPYLVRSKNQEIITIDKDEFKFGKIPGMADYLLSDNPAVSRMHAIIHNVDNTYYICDNYSTNATYLNGEKLEPGKNYLLMNGVKIRLANDEFTYICEE